MKRRRMTRPGAPPPVPPGYGLAPVIPLPGVTAMVVEAGGSYEVIRQHAETSRVQLAAWTVPTSDAAEALARSLNAQTERAGGVTLASSGLLERGWRYVSRKAGTP